MIEISLNKDLVGAWVFRQLNKTWGPQGRTAIGVIDGDRVLAGVVFEEYSGPGGSICVHVAIDHPHVPIRKLLVTCAVYAFNQMAVDKILGFVPSFNKEALNFDLRIGFTPEAIIEGAYPDGDLVILGMTREQCKFLPREQKAA